MGLKDIGSKLPPGFRFHPSDEELVCHYLSNKIRVKSDHVHVKDVEDDEALKGSTDLVEIDLHICEPWQLPDVAKLNAKEWYFFSFRDRKYSTGYRTNRATISGYWKATGKDRTVLDSRTNQLVGMRKTLVFYKNRAPNGIKTTWIMHEFRLECPNMPPKEDWVLCRVFNKVRDASPQDTNNDHQTQVFEINDAPNYNNQIDHEMKIQVCDQWDQLIKQPSRTIDHPYHHNCQHQTISCGWNWEQMMLGSVSSSSSHGPNYESFLNLLHSDNNSSVNITDAHHQNDEKTCMGLSSDGMVSHMECGRLSFETDNFLVFQ